MFYVLSRDFVIGHVIVIEIGHGITTYYFVSYITEIALY